MNIRGLPPLILSLPPPDQQISVASPFLSSLASDPLKGRKEVQEYTKQTNNYTAYKQTHSRHTNEYTAYIQTHSRHTNKYTANKQTHSLQTNTKTTNKHTAYKQIKILQTNKHTAYKQIHNLQDINIQQTNTYTAKK